MESPRPFLVWRDSCGEQRILPLESDGALTVGRRAGNGIVLGGDRMVSRVHAQLEAIGGEWTVVDDGLSTNGTFVNGTRLARRWRLRDGDVIRVGQTVIEFRNPADDGEVTTVSPVAAQIDELSAVQRRILAALCRRHLEEGPFAAPASNPEIAAELFLSIDTIKAHIRTLCHRFGIADLPPNQKRARLAELAIQSGLVADSAISQR